MKFIFVFVLLVMATSVAAYDLSEYPSPFIVGEDFDGEIVVGDESPSSDTLAALEIATNLKVNAPYADIKATLLSEATLDSNLILVGNGCNNPLVMEYMEDDDCMLGLNEGLSVIKTFEEDGNVIIVVAGHSGADTRKAAVALAQHTENEIESDEVEVVGDLDEPEITEPGLRGLFPEAEEEQKLVVPSCNTHDDCADNEKCSITIGCEALDCPEGTVAENHRCTVAEPEPEPELIEEPIPELIEEPEPPKGFFGSILDWFANLF